MSLFVHHRLATVSARQEGPSEAVHDTWELTLVTRGAEWVSLDEAAPQQAARSALVVIPPGTLHSSHTRQVGVEFQCLHLDAHQAEPLFDELALRALEPHTFLASPEVCAAFRSLRHADDLLANDDGSVTLLGALSKMMTTQRRRAELPHRRRLERVEALIHAAPDQPHTVSSLAAVAGLSPFHFVRSFRQYFGRTPHQLVLDVRLERAQVLMRTDRSLTEIAHEVGFASSSRLTEAFTRRFGSAPSKWREAQRPCSTG